MSICFSHLKSRIGVVSCLPRYCLPYCEVKQWSDGDQRMPLWGNGVLADSSCTIVYRLLASLARLFSRQVRVSTDKEHGRSFREQWRHLSRSTHTQDLSLIFPSATASYPSFILQVPVHKIPYSQRRQRAWCVASTICQSRSSQDGSRGCSTAAARAVQRRTRDNILPQ